MTILNRGIGKAVAIGSDIVVTVLAIEGHDVRIGVNAPNTMRVCNEELLLRVSTENQSCLIEDQGNHKR